MSERRYSKASIQWYKHIEYPKRHYKVQLYLQRISESFLGLHMQVWNKFTFQIDHCSTFSQLSHRWCQFIFSLQEGLQQHLVSSTHLHCYDWSNWERCLICFEPHSCYCHRVGLHEARFLLNYCLGAIMDYDLEDFMACQTLLFYLVIHLVL